MIVILKSVGCVYDTETKMTFAMYNESAQKLYNKIYDEESGTHLDDCDEHWVDTLSDEDVLLINESSEKELKSINPKKEIRVFGINVTQDGHESVGLGEWNSITNDAFIDIAEGQGNVWSLQGFQDAYNKEELSLYDYYIRFIEIDLFELA